MPASALLRPPARPVSPPLRLLGRRFVMATLLLLATVGVVYAGRSGYRDSADGEMSLLDAFYYATVSLSTTGYGDVVPVSDTARLVNIVVVTPLRILFLLLVVGTHSRS